jgi:hypothetical protein
MLEDLSLTVRAMTKADDSGLIILSNENNKNKKRSP